MKTGQGVGGVLKALPNSVQTVQNQTDHAVYNPTQAALQYAHGVAPEPKLKTTTLQQQSVVMPELGDQQVARADAVDDAMFSVDAPRPVAG